MADRDLTTRELEEMLARIAEHEREAEARHDTHGARYWAERYDHVESELDRRGALV